VEELASSGGANICGTQADIGSINDVRQLFAFVDRELGGTDILINNAVNLTGVFHCCREAVAQFRRRGGGFIINIGSLLGKTAVAGGAAYCASKFGLNGLSEAIMLDCRNENIGVSTIVPGSVDTELFGASAGADWKIQPEDVAQAVVTVLEMPQRTLVSRVEMRPLKPQQ
jgi:NAD(P)-dependent dehydrogenase (short-subunit alcohol dehydrogenase family)